MNDNLFVQFVLGIMITKKEKKNMKLMNLEVRKTLGKKIFTFLMIFAMVGAFAVPVFAKEFKDDYDYHAFDLTCYNKIISTKGLGSTIGAPKPYYNNVIITVYNKKGKCKGSDSDYNLQGAANAEVRGIALTKSKTYHSALDIDYTQILPFNKQIVISLDK